MLDLDSINKTDCDQLVKSINSEIIISPSSSVSIDNNSLGPSQALKKLSTVRKRFAKRLFFEFALRNKESCRIGARCRARFNYAPYSGLIKSDWTPINLSCAIVSDHTLSGKRAYSKGSFSIQRYQLHIVESEEPSQCTSRKVILCSESALI